MSRISSKPRDSHDLAAHGTEASLLLDVEQRHSAAATVVNGTRVVPYDMERHTVVEAYTKSSSRSWCLGMRHIASGPDPRNECDHRTYKDLLRIAVSNGRLPHPSPAESRPAFVRQSEGWPEGGRMVSSVSAGSTENKPSPSLVPPDEKHGLKVRCAANPGFYRFRRGAALDCHPCMLARSAG